MPRIPRSDDRELAAYLALRFSRQPMISAAELAAEGVEEPLRAVLRRDVVAHLGQYGIRIRRRKGSDVLHALKLRPVLERMDLEPPSEQGEDYFYEPPEARFVVATLRAGLFPYVSGPTGSGKSSLLERLMLALAGDGEIHKVSLTGESSTDDLFGVRALRGGCTTFQPGPVVLAMRDRRPLILEELDAAPPEVLFSLHELLTRRPVRVPQGEDAHGAPLVVDPWARSAGAGDAPFVVAATGNTLGRGDRAGHYRGTQVLNSAFLDRWTVIELDYPSERAEREILVRRTDIELMLAQRIVAVAHLARRAFDEDGGFLFPFSVRRTLQWAQAVSRMGLTVEEGFCLMVLESASPEDRDPLCEWYQRVFGASVDRACLHGGGA